MTNAPTTSPARQATGGSSIIAFFRHAWAGLRVLLGLTVIAGVAYPLAVWALGQAAFPWQANGSLITADGDRTTSAKDAVGSQLIGQPFDDPRYFWPRPSASNYDPLASGGTNLGPSDPDLVAAIEQRRAALATANQVDPAAIPPDALTASASGLDPDISEAYARIQVSRIAKARGLAPEQVTQIVDRAVRGPDLGVIGAAHANVLRMNLELDKLHS